MQFLKENILKYGLGKVPGDLEMIFFFRSVVGELKDEDETTKKELAEGESWLAAGDQSVLTLFWGQQLGTEMGNVGKMLLCEIAWS